MRRARRRSDAQHPEKDQERFRRNAGTGALDESSCTHSGVVPRAASVGMNVSRRHIMSSR